MSLEEDIEECRNCKFVHERQEPVEGGVGYETYKTVTAHFCVRYPPSTVGIIRVSHDGWCGEYKPKEE